MISYLPQKQLKFWKTKNWKYRFLVISLLFISVFIFAGVLFMNLAPQFGRTPDKAQREVYSRLQNYNEGRFQNENASPMDLNNWSLLKEYIAGTPNREPSKKLPVLKPVRQTLLDFPKDSLGMVWLGHSSFLLLMDGLKILVDPVLSKKPSPVPFFGPSRYSSEVPLSAEEMPDIDVLVISHDHYDHLDHQTILSLKHKVKHYFVPLGVGNHLRLWGVADEKITELNWWETETYESLTLTAAPARHFSGRGILDRSKTLWASWIITGKSKNVFYSGDSGYDKHFQTIGQKYGPFDLALLECGQYHPDWKYLHMMPEETAQAAADLQSKLSVPVHWGAFTLALHEWTDPVKRSLSHAQKLGVPFAAPQMGELLIAGAEPYSQQAWWEGFEANSN